MHYMEHSLNGSRQKSKLAPGGIEKFRPYLNPKRTVRHLGAVPRCSTNPDSMKGIRRGSTPPVGQKVRDSLLNYRKDCLTVFQRDRTKITVQSAQDIRSG